MGAGCPIPVETVSNTVEKKNPLDNLKPWKPGESGNPDGRPPVPEEIKKIRNLTKNEIKEVGSILLKGREDELVLLVKDPETPVLRKWMANVALKALERGDMMTLNALLDRLVGRVKEEIDLNVIPKPFIIERKDGTEVELGARAVEEIGDADDSSDT